MEEEEFLGTRYPYFWLDEMKNRFFKISIEEIKEFAAGE